MSPRKRKEIEEVETVPLREITTHHDGHGLSEKLRIEADEPGPGGASHHYRVFYAAPEGIDEDLIVAEIQFQKGPRDEEGSSPGIIESVLIAILMDRMTAFQAGPYACDENTTTLTALTRALVCQRDRANARAKRGVLGKSIR